MADEPTPTPAEERAGDDLDAQIDALLAGRPTPGTPPVVSLVAAAVRTDPPGTLADRVEAEHAAVEQRRWRPFRYVTALMAYLFVSQGVGNLIFGEWVADGVGDDFSPHLTRESGFALIAAGIAVAFGAWRPRSMAPVSLAASVPLAVAFGIAGFGEIGVFAAGAALHLTQGAVGVALAVTYWRTRRTPGRDTSRPPDEGGA